MNNQEKILRRKLKMINKIDNWDKVEANYGESKKLVAGGYVCVIYSAKKEQSKTTGKEMLVVSFDIAEGDFKGFYMNKYKNAPRDNNNPVEPKWQGKYYIVLEGEGYEGRLKAFTTSIEESNEGYVWDWNEESLKGKRFGGIFRDEQFLYNGEVLTSAKLWQVRSVKRILDGDFQIPRAKELSNEDKMKPNNNFVPVNDDMLPF